MAAKKRGLGRGLESLLSNRQNSQGENANAPVGAAGKAEVGHAEDGELAHVPVEFITRGPYQPRKDMDPEALEELSSSIKSQGVMQPIVVRQVSEQQYEIIAGERRWRATQLAGLHTIPVIIRHVPDEAAMAMSLIENVQRENLNPIEEAAALHRLQEEFNLTHQQIADAVGKSRVAVTNMLRLMNLTTEVRQMLENGDVEMGHARALLSLKPKKQTDAAHTVAAKGLSVRQTENLVRRLQSQTKTDEKQRADPDVKRLEEDLSERVGVPVLIQHTAKGKGKIVFKYNSLDELDGIIEHIK